MGVLEHFTYSYANDSCIRNFIGIASLIIRDYSI